MHLNVSIVALVTCLTLKALSAVSFSEPVWKGDLGISMPMLNFSDAMPLEMPKAEAYLVTSSSSQKLIDKFNATDLWVNTIFRGRWFDYNGNQLTIAKLTHTPPLEDSAETTTRFDFYSTLPSKEVDPENDQEIHALVKYTSLSEIIRAYKPHRSKRRNIKELWFYETTNASSIVCAFRPISRSASCPPRPQARRRREATSPSRDAPRGRGARTPREEASRSRDTSSTRRAPPTGT